jgi:LacI family transcriptional regulator
MIEGTTQEKRSARSNRNDSQATNYSQTAQGPAEQLAPQRTTAGALPIHTATPRAMHKDGTMAVTMKDIAQDLGVAVITVSKAMRNQSDVSERTRNRILERAKELNYIPNLAARTLVTGRTYLVGLIVPDLLHTFFGEIANSLSEVLLKKGYCLTVSISNENLDHERDVVNHLLARKPDVLILASAAEHSELIAQIQKRGTPLVLIDRRFADLETNYIGADDKMVGILATEHLISVGCKQIVHMRGPDTSPGIGRLKGYLDVLAKHKIKAPACYITAPKMADVRSREHGEVVMKRLLSVKPRPDGVFCFNDPMAIGAIDAILAAGLRVPEDVAVIGSGNLHYGSDLRVPLSSIDQQTKLIGERAAKLTLSLVESKEPMKPRSFIIQPKLVVRASTGRNGRSRRKS